MPLIAFVSPKGGVGKTTLTAHVGAVLVRRGYQVLALDLDPQNALRLHLGLPIREEGGFMAELEGGGAWRGAVRDTPSGVRLLPHGMLEPLPTLQLGVALLQDPEMLAAPVREMLTEPDLVVLADCPPGPSAALGALTPLISLMVVVLLADAGSASLLPSIVSNRFLGRGTLAGRAGDRACVVLNGVDRGAPLGAAVLDCAINALGSRLLGAVARDEALAEALADKRLLLDGEPGAAEDLQVVTDAIVTRAGLPPPGRRRRGSGFSALSDWGLR